jgi:hypothetical protein
MTKLELFNLRLEVKRSIIDRINAIYTNELSTIQSMYDAAKTIEELGLKYLSRYYPLITENIFSSISRRMSITTDPLDMLVLSKVITTASTEPYSENRRDDTNFDLSVGVTIGRRRFEDIGNIELKNIHF